MNFLTRFTYSALLYFLSPYLLIRLFWKGQRAPAYKKRIHERFALKTIKQNSDIWVHAVSLGEVIAATPLIEALLKKGWSIMVTTTTPTGSQQVKTRFGNRVNHRYLPYDLPGALQRFFKQVAPKGGVIMETEIWPNLIYKAHKAHIPLFLANARLSLASAKRYRKLQWLVMPLLNCFHAILPQSDEDAKRFMALGIAKEKIQMLGNMKFDGETACVEDSLWRNLKNLWGNMRPVIIAASTHEDEEAQLLTQWRRLQKAIQGALLLIAPRHPERFPVVHTLCLDRGFNTALRSNTASITSSCEIIVLDSIGELLSFYKASDYAFVGGSLTKTGGHNVLEPIAMSVPVISGNKVHNFKSICQELQKEGAIELVSSAQQWADKLIYLHNHREQKEQMIEKASAILARNKGAVLRHFHYLEANLLIKIKKAL